MSALSLRDALNDSPAFRKDTKERAEEISDLLSHFHKFLRMSAKLDVLFEKTKKRERKIGEVLSDISKSLNDDSISQNISSYVNVANEIAQAREDHCASLKEGVLNSFSGKIHSLSSELKSSQQSYAKSKAVFETTASKYSSLRCGVDKEQIQIEDRYLESRSSYREATLSYVKTLNNTNELLIIEFLQAIRRFFNGYEMSFNQGQMIMEMNKKCVTQTTEHILNGEKKLKEKVTQWDTFIHDVSESKPFSWPDSPAVTPVSSTHSSPSLSNLGSIEGYLFKRTNGTITRWKRKYFQVKDGILYYFEKRQSAILATFSLLLTNVKPIPLSTYGRRFCFEIITPTNENKRMILQAESNEEMRNWINVLSYSKEQLITGAQEIVNIPPNMVGKYRSRSLSENPLPLYTRNEILENETRDLDDDIFKIREKFAGLLFQNSSNKFCADCGKEDAKWISINLGVVLCIECSGAHRLLGVHVSKIRSITLDFIQPEVMLTVLKLGNKVMNDILEEKICDEKLSSNAGQQERIDWVKQKYEEHKFMNHDQIFSKSNFKSYIKKSNLPEILRCILSNSGSLKNDPYVFYAVQHNSIEALTLLLNNGFDPDLFSKKNKYFTPLHLSATKSNNLMLAILLQGNANPLLKDAEGRTAYDILTQLEEERQSEQETFQSAEELTLARTLVKFASLIRELPSDSDNSESKQIFTSEFKSYEKLAKKNLYEMIEQFSHS